MEKNSTNNFITYHLGAIREIETHIKAFPELLMRDFSGSNLKFDLNHQFLYDVKTNLFAINLLITIRYEITDINTEIVRYSNLMEFYIDELEKYLVLNDESTFLLPEHVLATLVGLSISTTRGILFSKLQGHFLNNHLLPIVNPTEIVRTFKKV